jgi:hypothetical protein
MSDYDPVGLDAPLAVLSRTTSIMPLSQDAPLVHHVPMSNSSVLFVKDPLGRKGYSPQANNSWVRFLSSVFASSLDRQLAAGVAPEATRLLAARADKLVSPSARLSLAENWQGLLEQARKSPMGRTRRVPLCGDRIGAAEAEIHGMISALAASRPSTARGVAMASQLLTDGVGPLYNSHSTRDLRTSLVETTMHLEAEAFLIESI